VRPHSIRVVPIAVLVAASLALIGGAMGVVPAATAAGPLTVQAPAGTVRGIADGAAREWRGIPYAAPPLGGLRWRPPQPAAKWSGTRDATAFGPICAQPGFDFQTGAVVVNGSEDCLYLNVFAPSDAPRGPLPVMVHLHGGSNWGFRPYRDASNFVSKGVIVVTVGYRLGVFGFVGHEALSAEGGGTSGEYGLLDQISALKWVKANIAAFGGNPNNVTLFGESAGSFDAAALVVSPLSKGLFQKAALQTEAWSAFYGESILWSEDMGKDMSFNVGCADASDVLACLRATSTEDLVLSMGFDDVVPRVGGVVLPESVVDLLANSSIPLLIGSNTEEAAHFLGEHIYGDEPYLPAYYFHNTSAIAGPQNGDEVRELYPVAAFDTDLWAAVAAFTDAIYTCPMRQVGLTTSGPVWRYLYTHRLENNPFLNGARAAHFLDEPILWHDPELLEGFGAADYAFTKAENALSETMSRYWTNFAKAGNPNGSGLTAWPAFEPSHERVLRLDNTIASISDWRVDQCTFYDSVPQIFAPANVYTPRLGG
jgi:para-nitrobenzyl esterase